MVQLWVCNSLGQDDHAALAMHCHMHQCVDFMLVVVRGGRGGGVGASEWVSR